MEIVPVKFEDFDPEYKEMDKTIDHDKVSLQVSNHVDASDFHVNLMLGFTSLFLSKSSVKKVPIYGSLGPILQCILLDRTNKKERENVLSLIVERIAQANKGEMPGLCMYPEGTTSNGEQLLTFKKGAFYGQHPMKVTCIKYDTGPGYFKMYKGYMT